MPNDLSGLVPASLTVCFPASADGQITTIETPITVTLTSLNLPEFQGITGAPWDKVLHRYEIAEWSGLIGKSTFLNEGQLTALAEQVATDWYHWQLEPLDIQYTSPVPWNPDGLADIEWSQVGNIKTRLIRGPWNPQEDLLTPAPLVVNNSLIIENVYITNVYSTINFYNIVNFYNVVNFYETIIIIDGVIWGNPVQTPIVTEVCYYPFTRQFEIETQTFIGGTDTDLVTATFMLLEPTTAIVFGYMDWAADPGGYSAIASLTVDGVVQFLAIPQNVNGESIRDVMSSQAWVVPLAAGMHTIILSAKVFSAAGAVAAGINTNLVIHADGVLVSQHQYVFLPNGTQMGGTYCVVNPQNCCTGSSSGTPECALCDPDFPIADQWIITFSLGLCPGIGGPGACPCCDGPTPSAWDFDAAGFSPEFPAFNGHYDMRLFSTIGVGPGEYCLWQNEPLRLGNVHTKLSVPCSGLVSLVMSEALPDGGGASAFYESPALFTGDCCSPITLSLVSSVPAVGAPPTIKVTPVGCSDGTTISGPITVTYIGGCCWYGVSETDPTIAALWCINENPDGTTYWQLTVLQGGVAIAVWKHQNGHEAVDCCAPVLNIPLTANECLIGLPANAFPQGCGGSSSGGGSGIVTSCCPEPINAILQASFKVTPPPGPGNACFNDLVFPMVYTPGYYPFDPSNPSGDAWVGTFSCSGAIDSSANTVTLECLISGFFRMQIKGPCSPLGTGVFQNIGPAGAVCPPAFKITSQPFNADGPTSDSPGTKCFPAPFPGLTIVITD